MTDYVRGEDVLDIWFDSGASWAAVLEGAYEIPTIVAVYAVQTDLVELFTSAKELMCSVCF